MWDRYAYDYGDRHLYGNHSSPVRPTCAVRGPYHRPILGELPAVASRVGVDSSLVNVGDDDAVLWLRALVWPEHRARAQGLECAVRLARADRPSLVGVVLDVLPALLAGVRPGAAICVFHTLTLNQFSEAPSMSVRTARRACRSSSPHQDLVE